MKFRLSSCKFGKKLNSAGMVPLIMTLAWQSNPIKASIDPTSVGIVPVRSRNEISSRCSVVRFPRVVGNTVVRLFCRKMMVSTTGKLKVCGNSSTKVLTPSDKNLIVGI